MLLNVTEYGKSEKRMSRRFKSLMLLAKEEEMGQVLGAEWIQWKNARKAAGKAAMKAHRATKNVT